jgi:hypothetical protein
MTVSKSPYSTSSGLARYNPNKKLHLQRRRCLGIFAATARRFSKEPDRVALTSDGSVDLPREYGLRGSGCRLAPGSGGWLG